MRNFIRKITQLSFASRAVIFAIAVAMSPVSAGANQACLAVFDPAVVDALLTQQERPAADVNDQIDVNKTWQYLKPQVNSEIDPRFFKVLEEGNLEILKMAKGREIFFVARDGEWFYDALTAAMRHFPSANSIEDKVHLLNLSRPVAMGTNAATLMKYLKANGLDFEKILSGEAKVLVIDTGERGSIFVSLLKNVIKTHDFSHPDWRQRLNNLVDGFEVRLLHSSMKSNATQLKKNWANCEAFDLDEVLNDIDELGFGEILRSKRKDIGIPVAHNALHEWIVSTFERRKHWDGRATTVNAQGKVTQTQDIDRDRTGALYSQMRIFHHFSKTSVWKRFSKVIDEAIESFGVTGVPAVATIPAPTKVTTVKVKPGLTLKPGDLAETSSGARYQINSFIDRGRRGEVYLAQTEKGERVAVKVAVANDAETLKSFAEEEEKYKGYTLAGIPHAKLVEIGTDFMVKELIEGVRGDQFMKTWVGNGMPTGTKELKTLSRLLKKSAVVGIYIGDLNPKNLIWDGTTWKVIDSGSWRDDLSEIEIKARYAEKIGSRWNKGRSAHVQQVFLKELKLKGSQ